MRFSTMDVAEAARVTYRQALADQKAKVWDRTSLDSVVSYVVARRGVELKKGGQS
jgi:hypothetical protein